MPAAFSRSTTFKPYTRAALAEVVKGERVTGKPCAG
jgi:hypothetical protein